MLKIRNKKTRKVADLHRDVCHVHAAWIHEQLGTKDESDLQLCLDTLSLTEFAENAGSEDCCGIFAPVPEADEYLGAERIDFAEKGNGFPGNGAIIVDHETESAWRVLPDAALGDGRIETHGPGMPNTTTLRVVAEDYEENAENPNAWEI